MARGLIGTREEKGARFEASTSEVYGDPEIHPQVESYYGNVNTKGQKLLMNRSVSLKRLRTILI